MHTSKLCAYVHTQRHGFSKDPKLKWEKVTNPNEVHRRSISVRIRKIHTSTTAKAPPFSLRISKPVIFWSWARQFLPAPALREAMQPKYKKLQSHFLMRKGNQQANDVRNPDFVLGSARAQRSEDKAARDLFQLIWSDTKRLIVLKLLKNSWFEKERIKRKIRSFLFLRLVPDERQRQTKQTAKDLQA